MSREFLDQQGIVLAETEDQCDVLLADQTVVTQRLARCISIDTGQLIQTLAMSAGNNMWLPRLSPTACHQAMDGEKPSSLRGSEQDSVISVLLRSSTTIRDCVVNHLLEIAAVHMVSNVATQSTGILGHCREKNCSEVCLTKLAVLHLVNAGFANIVAPTTSSKGHMMFAKTTVHKCDSLIEQYFDLIHICYTKDTELLSFLIDSSLKIFPMEDVVDRLVSEWKSEADRYGLEIIKTVSSSELGQLDQFQESLKAYLAKQLKCGIHDYTMIEAVKFLLINCELDEASVKSTLGLLWNSQDIVKIAVKPALNTSNGHRIAKVIIQSASKLDEMKPIHVVVFAVCTAHLRSYCLASNKRFSVRPYLKVFRLSLLPDPADVMSCAGSYRESFLDMCTLLLEAPSLKSSERLQRFLCEIYKLMDSSSKLMRTFSELEGNRLGQQILMESMDTAQWSDIVLDSLSYSECVEWLKQCSHAANYSCGLMGKLGHPQQCQLRACAHLAASMLHTDLALFTRYCRGISAVNLLVLFDMLVDVSGTVRERDRLTLDEQLKAVVHSSSVEISTENNFCYYFAAMRLCHCLGISMDCLKSCSELNCNDICRLNFKIEHFNSHADAQTLENLAGINRLFTSLSSMTRKRKRDPEESSTLKLSVVDLRYASMDQERRGSMTSKTARAGSLLLFIGQCGTLRAIDHSAALKVIAGEHSHASKEDKLNAIDLILSIISHQSSLYNDKPLFDNLVPVFHLSIIDLLPDVARLFESSQDVQMNSQEDICTSSEKHFVCNSFMLDIIQKLCVLVKVLANRCRYRTALGGEQSMEKLQATIRSVSSCLNIQIDNSSVRLNECSELCNLTSIAAVLKAASATGLDICPCLDAVIQVKKSKALTPDILTDLIKLRVKCGPIDDSVIDGLMEQKVLEPDEGIRLTTPLFRQLVRLAMDSLMNDTRSQLSNEQRLSQWLVHACRFASFVSSIQSSSGTESKSKAMASCLVTNACNKFVPLMIKDALPLADVLLRDHQADNALALLRSLQPSTRFLQHASTQLKWASCTGGWRQKSAMPRVIPKLRKQMESLIFQVRRVLKKHGVADAFSCGQLKHRDLQGQEISSQLPPEAGLGLMTCDLNDDDDGDDDVEVCGMDEGTMSGVKSDGTTDNSDDSDASSD